MREKKIIVLSVFVIIIMVYLIVVNQINFSSVPKKITQDYSLGRQSFKHAGFCEGGPWRIYSNDVGEVYAFEWDTIGGIGSYIVDCKKMVWLEGEQTFEDINVSGVSSAYNSGEEVSYTSFDRELLYINGWDGMFYALNKTGEIIYKINIVKGMKTFLEDAEYESISAHYVEGNFVYAIIFETDYSNEKYSLQKFNLQTGEVIDAFEIKDFIPAKFESGLIYGYMSDRIVGLDVNGEIVRSIKLPSSEKVIGQFSNRDYNKVTFAIRDSTIYYSDDKGIYCALEDETEFSMIIDSSDADLFSCKPL